MHPLPKSAFAAILAFSSLIRAAEVDQLVNCTSLVINAPAGMSIQVQDESTAKVPDRVERLKKAACLAIVGAAHLQAIGPVDAVGLRFVVVDHVLGRPDNAYYEGSNVTKVGIGVLDKSESSIRFGVAHEVGHLVQWDKLKGKLWGAWRFNGGVTGGIGGLTAILSKKHRLLGLALAVGGGAIVANGDLSACSREKLRAIAADNFAVRAMHATGMGLETAKNHAIQIMRANKQEETVCVRWPPFGDRLTSHPSTDQRIDAIAKITVPSASRADKVP